MDPNASPIDGGIFEVCIDPDFPLGERVPEFYDSTTPPGSPPASSFLSGVADVLHMKGLQIGIRSKNGEDKILRA